MKVRVLWVGSRPNPAFPRVPTGSRTVLRSDGNMETVETFRDTQPGDIVELDDALAEGMIAAGSAEPLASPEPRSRRDDEPPKGVDAPEAGVETTAVAAPESAAARTATPRGAPAAKRPKK